MLALLLLVGFSASAQVTIYSQNFDAVGTGMLPVNSSSQDGWLVNGTNSIVLSAYQHRWGIHAGGSAISGRSLGMSFYNGVNLFSGFGSQFTNCSYDSKADLAAFRVVPTTGYTNITVTFDWKIYGEDFGGWVDYGQVGYSTTGGAPFTWINTGGNGSGLYHAQTTATQTGATVSFPAAANNSANFTIAFRNVIDECGGTSPMFIVDNIVVQGTSSSSCVAGTASPAFQYVPTNGTADLTLTGYVGSTIQWQVSPNGTSGWTNVSGGTGATTDNYTSGSLADGTYYYRAVVTDGGACTEFSNVVEVTVAANPVYCSGAGVGNAFSNNHIEEIGFHEWSDPNPGNFSNNYLDYTDTTTYGYATVVPGQYHHFNATIRSNGTGTASTTVAAWIDFNRDGVFDNTPFSSGGELLDIVNYTSTVGNTYAAYFTVPLTASGTMRMRVRALRGNFGSIDPCGAYTNSQTKDLTVKAIPAISGGQVCGTVNGSGDVVTANSALDKVYISRVLVNGPSGTLIDVNGAFFGVQAGSTVTMYNYSNMMGGFSNGLVMEAGASYTVNIEHSGYNSVVGLFIDWNGDGDFNDANEIVGRTASTVLNPYVFNFTAPTGLTDGMQVAMRVRLYYDDLSSYGNFITACNNINDGLQQYSEVEDYRVTLSAPPLVCAPVSNLSAAIGTPANGLQHHMDVTWDALSGATGYDIEYSNDGSSWTSLGSTATNSFDHNFGDNPNVAMYYRVRAKDASTTCAWATMATPVYTACDVPEVPSTSNETQTTLDLDIVAETPVANPAITTYSIYEENTGLYVQANGALGATEVFQTQATWGTVTVNGLTQNTEYCFVLTARNFDGDERGGSGASIQAMQTFDSSGDLATGTSNTSVWWSPSTCTTGGQVWNGSNGCTGGAVGFEGAWNNFYGCFLRSPETNCTGLNTVVMTFDLSNSYFAAQPNDRVYFNFWDPTASTYVSASSVNGVAGSSLYFTVARTCEQVVVEFDLTGVVDKSALMFYLNADCAYNNSNVFSYWSDNIMITEPAPVGCATTLSAAAPDLVVQSITPLTPSICGSGTVDFEVVVENQGTVGISGGTNFDVAAYVGNQGCTGTAVSTQTITTGLAASATTTLTFSLALSGSSDVSFEVDAGAAITEQDEINNCLGDNSVTVGSGLGGLYTIDATQATGGTNYASFSDAAADLNTYGVCAAVIFDVRTDTYTENITLTDIAGVSNVNTVTFRSQSGNAADVILRSSSTDVVVLHNADYHIFQNITVSYTGTGTYSCFELQDDADNVTITGCVLNGGTSTSTANTNALIYVSETSTSYEIDSMVVENTTFNNGGNGIYFASSSSESTGIRVTGSTFDGCFRRGMYLDDCTAPFVQGNTFTNGSNANSSYTAIDIDNCSGATTIIENDIQSDYIKYGIWVDNSDGSAGNEVLVANNMISMGGSGTTFNQAEGIRLLGTDYVNVYFNSVNIYNTYNTLYTACIYLTSTSVANSVNIQNNILSMTGGGNSQVCIVLTSISYLAHINTWDHNNYYTTGDSRVAYISGYYDDVLSLQTYTSKDANSIDTDPLFTSATDLHLGVGSGAVGAGTTIAGITTDIDGDSRTTPPTIGADEITAGCGTNVWTGTINNDWHIDGNWGCGVVPTKTTIVYIPSAPVNQPIVYSGSIGVCLSLEMEAGSELIIQEGARLEVAEP